MPVLRLDPKLKPISAIAFLKLIHMYGITNVYLNLLTHFKIFLTVSYRSLCIASNERSFSKIKLIKPPVRNLVQTTTIKKISNIINSEHDIARKLLFDYIIKASDKSAPNIMYFLCFLFV